MKVNNLCAVGKSSSHITMLSDGCSVHSDVANALQALKHAAKDAGFEFKVVSGFRDFERQLKIWNGKYLGLLPVYDEKNQLIDLDSLSEFQKITSILKFSALPGASRHHWGTEFDFVDQKALNDQQINLFANEYRNDGPHAPLAQWISEEGKKFGFTFPYLNHKGGISEEPWHISYKPVADLYLEHLENEPKILFDLIVSENIEGKEAILKNFEYILDHFVLNVNRD